MQEPMPAPPKTNELEGSASALLEAIVRAEVELHDLQERCSSLELAISLGREAVATAESLPAGGEPAKSTSGKDVPEASAASQEIPQEPPDIAPINPPKPLTIRKPEPAKAAAAGPEPTTKPARERAEEPVLEPVAASAGAPPVADEAIPASETPERPAAAPASLEEQAAALRAAMTAPAAPAAGKPEATTGRPRSDRAEDGSSAMNAPPATPPASHPVDQEQRPFKPKRSTPLKSRLAGLDVTADEPEGESYSERSAELEQLLRGRDED
jgi:hypothetical protein